MPDLIVQHVAKEYPTRSQSLCVLRACSLELSRGQNLAIIGPSGSGKSTLLNIIGTLDTPTQGSVTLTGCDPFTLREPELARFRNRQIGFVFQDHHLLPQCSVLENVLLPTIVGSTPSPQAFERAHKLLERVGLAQRLDHLPAELSGGERQRVAIARALICSPALLLADEPTGNLDRTTAHSIGDLLLEMQQLEGTMMIVVTHSSELAGRLGRQLQINDGTLEEVKRDE
jgi:lipoprotein-releasing system ATP-binding protein